MTSLFQASVIAGYERCAVAWAAHDGHEISPGKTCKTTDQCNYLTNEFGAIVDSLFRPEDAERWLLSGPPDLLDWSAEDSGDRVRDVIAATLSSEAWGLIFPVNRPSPAPVSPTFDA